VPLAVQALAEMRRADLDNMPFGVRGESAAPRRAEPAPVPPEPLRIEPADWEAEAAERGEPVQPPEPSHAAMFGGFDPPEPNIGPPQQLGPLARPTFPAPDWEAEEQERARQEKRETELEPERRTSP
jgi:hypothetical protein